MATNTPGTLRTIVVENEDGKFLVLENDVLGQHLLRGERWEPRYTRILPLLLPKGGTAVDVGACIGYTSVIMARAVGPLGKVISFEPLRLAFQQLCGTIALNGLTNVYPHNFALGHADGVTVSMVPVDYHEEGVNVMNSCVGTGGDLVVMRTLDSFELNNISVLKVDVQGCELYVVRGAEATIRRNRPYILIEIEEPQLRHQNSSSADLMVHLFTHDYILLRLIEGFSCDYICVPAEKRDVISSLVQAAGPSVELLELRDGVVTQVAMSAIPAGEARHSLPLNR